jgi:hypothetical protein
MANKKKAAEPDSVSGAGAVDPAVGKTAAVPEPKPAAKSTKIPKLAKKDKSRLPRRQKKALQKANARQSRG